MVSDAETAAKDKPKTELVEKDSTSKPAGEADQSVASSKSSDTSEASSPTEDSKKVCMSWVWPRHFSQELCELIHCRRTINMQRCLVCASLRSMVKSFSPPQRRLSMSEPTEQFVTIKNINK